MDEGNDLIGLRTCGTLIEASLLRSVLEAHGIFCHLQGEHHRNICGPLHMIEVRLLVPSAQAELADEILRLGEEGEAALVPPYRDESPLPDPEPLPVQPVLWRPVHTWLAVVGVLLVLAGSAFVWVVSRFTSAL